MFKDKKRQQRFVIILNLKIADRKYYKKRSPKIGLP
tara:strand:+ start:4763 stop:4870 length:108 start_codon:yes stop_codon:yes gene_type:complete